VFELREAGHVIGSRMIEVRSRFGKSRVAQYTLNSPGK
jgi:hypothetical protein